MNTILMNNHSDDLEMSTVNKLLIDVSQCVYTSCYCEENIWKLCDSIRKYHNNDLKRCNVVFISNDNYTIPLWSQKSGIDANDHLAVWDYHVIMVYSSPSDESQSLVYDFDTILPFPCDFSIYSMKTFRSNEILKNQYKRMFRVIRADEFLRTFASDRSRMMNSDGSWIKPPPEYPCIRTDECHNNLEDFIAMKDFSIGDVITLEQFNDNFSNNYDSQNALNLENEF